MVNNQVLGWPNTTNVAILILSLYFSLEKSGQKPKKLKIQRFKKLIIRRNFVDILLTFCLESGKNKVAG